MSVKSEVLNLLESSKGEYVSGQEIANRLSVSRNAIWRAVKSLRSEGYQIESVTRLGYRLVKTSNKISVEQIAAQLPDQLRNIEIIVLDTVDSTNNEAKRMLASGYNKDCVIVAKEQSAGRGRRGRSFFSPKGGLYLSVVMQNRSQNRSDSRSAVLMTMVAALAASRAIDSCCGVSTKIKWVNDVMLDGKKVTGILTEGISDLETGDINSLVIGIGVNLAPMELTPELKDKASTVHLLEGHTKSMLAAKIIEELFVLSTIKPRDENLEINIEEENLKYGGTYKDLEDKQKEGEELKRLSAGNTAPAFMDEYRAKSMVLGKKVLCNCADRSFEALVNKILDDGSLEVVLNDGEHKILRDGEVSLLPLLGN